METKLATTSVLNGPTASPVIDTGKMTARCIFTTDSVDRVGDVVNIAGMDLTAYRQNPVVLFDHGKWFGDAIGKAQDSAGNFTVEVGEHAAWQTTHFFDTQLANQYFRLIELGGLNTNSIGYRTLKSRKNSAGGHFLDAIEVCELSWVSVPANSECLRAFLSKDKIEGKSLHPQLRAALEAQLPPKTTVTGGFIMKAVQVKKSLAKAAIAAAKKELPPDEPKAETPPVTEVTPVEEAPAPVEQKPALPHGAEMLQQVQSHLAELVAYCDQELPRLENDDVAGLILGICEETLESLTAICDTYATQYPDLEPLPEVSAEEDEEEAEPSEDVKDDEAEEGDDSGEEVKDDEPTPEIGKRLPRKSYSGGVKRLTKAMGTTIKECAEHLTEMKDAENLTSGQKLVCKHYAKELSSMCAEKEEAVVESKDDDAGDEGTDDIEKAYDALSPEDQKAFDQELAAWVEQQEAAERKAESQATHNARLATAAQRRASSHKRHENQSFVAIHMEQ